MFLSHEDRLDFMIEHGQGRVRAFTVNYRAVIRGRWKQVVRYDTSHGQPHVHMNWLLPKRRIRPLPEALSNAPPGIVLLWAEARLKENWQRYRKLMEKTQ